jgi:hypothetical protein
MAPALRQVDFNNGPMVMFRLRLEDRTAAGRTTKFIDIKQFYKYLARA